MGDREKLAVSVNVETFQDMSKLLRFTVFPLKGRPFPKLERDAVIEQLKGAGLADAPYPAGVNEVIWSSYCSRQKYDLRQQRVDEDTKITVIGSWKITDIDATKVRQQLQKAYGQAHPART